MLGFLGIVYCATVVVAINTCDNFKSTSLLPYGDDQCVVSPYAIDYSDFLTRPQTLEVPAQSPDSLQYKKDFSDYVILKHVIQQHISGKFLQYSQVSKNFLVHYRKTDGIFPFHYFW